MKNTVQVDLASFTLQDFLKLSETKPASEYIDSQIIQKPMPQGKHSTLQILQMVYNLRSKPYLHGCWIEKFLIMNSMITTITLSD